jgi:hypothetical protein
VSVRSNSRGEISVSKQLHEQRAYHAIFVTSNLRSVIFKRAVTRQSPDDIN